MECPRCQGFLVEEEAIDLLGGAVKVKQLRCVNCGGVFDPPKEGEGGY